MTTVTEAASGSHAPAPQSRGGIGQSVRDSLVVARRNLIRMLRIPNPVRSSRLGFTSRKGHEQ
ncbi:hypothetical protein [Streptomyces sp. NPDC058989]|uniref:hypothetical protein n=1 Tax=Streptomyces sp. NPDC058989 TaxID=3346686 RepID=UPI0036A5FE39